MVLAFSYTLWLSLIILTVTGFGMIPQLAASNTILQTILQTIVSDDKRGQVMAFYSMALMGMAHFGSLLAGSLAARVGVPGTLMLGGGLCLAGSLWFARTLPRIRASSRPVYVQQGILPDLATGVQQASTLQTPPEN